MVVDKKLLDETNARWLEGKVNLLEYTAHHVAKELIAWSPQFNGADYTTLVSKVRLWQLGLLP
ncbi:hypothetical protein [Bradyrhizobium sp. S3.7.6]